MSDIITVIQELTRLAQRLEACGYEVYNLADKKAETEREYRLALAKEIMKLRVEGMPVSIINDLARGNVAELKFKRDLAQSKYDSAMLSLRALQTSSSVLQTVARYQAEVEK